MNRRAFVTALAALPFVGGLFVRQAAADVAPAPFGAVSFLTDFNGEMHGRGVEIGRDLSAGQRASVARLIRRQIENTVSYYNAVHGFGPATSRVDFLLASGSALYPSMRVIDFGATMVTTSGRMSAHGRGPTVTGPILRFTDAERDVIEATVVALLAALPDATEPGS